jgi:hypothetical protein
MIPYIPPAIAAVRQSRDTTARHLFSIFFKGDEIREEPWGEGVQLKGRLAHFDPTLTRRGSVVSFSPLA